MADYALIDDYLKRVRALVLWRRDVDDLVAELEDHLYSAVEQSEAHGTGTELAQQNTLERFGDAGELATAFASTPRGGLAIPTRFTKDAGGAALMSVAALLLALGGFGLSSLFPDRAAGTDPDQFVLNGQTVAWIVATLALLGAGSLMIVAMVGLYRRHGGLGALGMLGLGVTALGVATTIFSWAFGVWFTLIAIGAVLFAVAILRRDIAPRLWTMVFGAGLAIGAVVWHAIRWLEVGSATANIFGVTIGALLMLAGFIGLGLWLRSEHPAEFITAAPRAIT